MSRPALDLKDRVFGKLTVIEATTKRVPKSGAVIWRCRCECGNIVEISSNNLTSSNSKSCGCMKDIDNALVVREKFSIENTNVLNLTTATYKNNTSGYKGVYRNKSINKWQAYINVNLKRVCLGSFDLLEDAIAARKKAEELYHKPIIDTFCKRSYKNE